MSSYRLCLAMAITLSIGVRIASAADVPSTQPIEAPGHVVQASHGIVVSVSAPASEVGVAILKQGGNAVDAAVATGFALAVTYPPGGNIAGGGFMLVHPALGGGDPTSFDFRECAPAAAKPTMYAKDESQYTHRAVAVPGTVRGFEMAHKRFGKLSWAQLLQPAIALARDGFIIDANLASSMNETLAAATEMVEFHRVFTKSGGAKWEPGDRLMQPDLAHTLQILADQGPEAFYTGPIARGVVAEMSLGNGLITAGDLASYQAIERKPLTTRYHSYDVYVPPPPSSGGTCLLEELNILENFEIKSWGRWSGKTLHVMAEAMRRANYDRARYVGDPAFVQVPEKLITPEYAQQLAQAINLSKATISKEISTDISLSLEGHDTTQFSIIDRDGMAVSTTYTLERLWGSRVVVQKMGFLLNNQMRAFNLFPGVTDTKGSIGTAPNLIAPGKRPISSMTPTIVARNGEVKLVTGSPGSQAIPHTILEIMISVLDFDMSLQSAIESPRMSHQWFPDQITYENPERNREAVESLKALGHVVVPPSPLPFQGDAHSIWVIQPNSYVGVADRRRSDRSSASGY